MSKRKETYHESQMSFLSPEDAELVHLMRLFVAEAARIYETRTGQNLEEALYIRSPQDAYTFFRVEMEQLHQEQVRMVSLDDRNRIIASRMIYQGTAKSTEIRVAEVFRPAIVDHATALIVAHNHPSGDPAPSPEDAQVTRQLVEAGELLGIDVLDHLVIGNGKFVSMKERGLGFNSSRTRLSDIDV